MPLGRSDLTYLGDRSVNSGSPEAVPLRLAIRTSAASFTNIASASTCWDRSNSTPGMAALASGHLGRLAEGVHRHVEQQCGQIDVVSTCSAVWFDY
eukprot:788247-Pleurochrysis_carterae.AAC.1